MEPDRRAAERAFAAGRYLDFLRAVGSDKGDFDQTVIRGLIPSVDLEEVDFSAGTTPNTLFELAAAVWDVDELLAISMFREAASGGSSAALAALGEGLNWIGDHEEATLWLRKAISANAGDAARLAGLLGESLFSAGDSVRFSEAEHLLKRGLAESEEFGVPLAKLLLAQQKVAEARELLERLVGADVYGAALLLGNLLAEEPGNLEAAEAAYRAGIASGDGHSAHNLAVMMLENGEPARARELHELAKLMGDSSPPGDRTRLDATQPASGAPASSRRARHHAWRNGPSASRWCGLVWVRARSSRVHLTLIGMRRAALPTGPLSRHRGAMDEAGEGGGLGGRCSSG